MNLTVASIGFDVAAKDFFILMKKVKIEVSKETKTNVMRLLDQAGIDYQVIRSSKKQGFKYNHEAPRDKIFKTLVTEGKSGEHYVFMVPVNQSLDLKKAAAVAGEKSVAMIPEKELLPLTGYVHGGCSPIGMKKELPTFIDEVAILYETIIFSAGKVGFSVELALEDLQKKLSLQVVDVILLD